MKVAVKILIDNKWVPINAENLQGRSIADWMLKTKDTAMAAIFDKEDKPRIFITNSDEWAAKYRDKGFCLTVQEFKDLAGTTLVPPIVIHTFPGSEFIEVISLKEEK